MTGDWIFCFPLVEHAPKAQDQTVFCHRKRPVVHFAGFCLFKAVYPLPFAYLLLQGDTRLTLFPKLGDASIFLGAVPPFRISYPWSKGGCLMGTAI